MVSLYVLAFCRTVIAFVFGVSSFSKALKLASFKQAIINFHILPKAWSGVVALFFVVSEGAIAILVIAGGRLLISGFTLASFFLLLFSGALVSVLVRGIRTSCNCFGMTTRAISSSDLWRNTAFILCALGGLCITIGAGDVQGNLNMLGWLLIGFGAVAFSTIWMQFGEIIQLFR